MSNLSVTRPYQKRRRFSREFKAGIVAECLEPGASVSRISLDNGPNANMVRRWKSWQISSNIFLIDAADNRLETQAECFKFQRYVTILKPTVPPYLGKNNGQKN
ncbi:MULTISPECIES: transposase [Marinobacter]|uniref:transposase n=1 Tax=Marinobacter TaxID=2742 RepID=UPI003B43C8B0